MKKSIIINNLLIQYHLFPSKGAKTAILLHGWRSEGSVWNAVAQRLNKDHYSVYALDLPGFGGSPAPKTPFTLSDYADVVLKFIEKMKLKNGILVGHSFGGRVAIQLTATKPTLVSKLILVDSAGFADTKKQGLKTLAKFMKPVFTPSYMQGIRKWIYEKLGAEDYLATPALQQTFVNVIEEDLSSNLSRIQIPTLLVWGEHDQDTPVSYGEKMHTAIHGSQLVILPDAGHFSFLDKPEEFYQTLIQFIK